MKTILCSFFVATCILFSCSKKSNTPADTAPANLTVNAVVSADSSGNVNFTAAATGAVTYDYDFGNGIFQTVANGIVAYKYTASGTYTVNVIAKSAGGLTTSMSVQVTVGLKQSLIWSEEFDTPGAPNSAKWGYDTGEGGWGNNELEYYTSRTDNAVVSNGTLKIIAKKENYGTSAYTSARLLSKDKFSFRYGKIEIRAKLPPDKGTWPAIWMLGNNVATAPWPACGEIDIMEHVGNQLNKIFGTIHYPGHSGANGVGGTTVNPTATTDFHRYALVWTATSIQFLIDDAAYFTTANNSSTMPFNQNFFIILNVAMGGNFGGSVDPAFSNAQMEIDYIRVYQ
jgi:Glycosyl hydrolases family 16/PKD domain